MKQLLDTLPPEIRDLDAMTRALPARAAGAGRRLGPVRRRAAASPSCARASGASASGGRRRASREATAILGGHVAGFLEADEPPCRPLGAGRGPGRSWPTRPSRRPGMRLPATRPCGADCSTRGSPSAGWCPTGERWTGPHERGDAHRDPGSPLRGAYDLVTALERAPGRRLRRLPRGGLDRRAPREASCSATRQTSSCWARQSSRAWSSTCGTARSCSRPASRCVTGRGWRGRSSPGQGTKLLGGFLRSLGVRARMPGARRGLQPASSWATPTRAHDGFVGHSVLGHWVNLGAAHHDVESQEHLRAGSAGGGRPADRDRAAIPGNAVRRPCEDGHRHYARHRHGGLRRRQSLRAADAAPVRAAVRLGWDRRERLTADGFLRVAERVMPRRGVELTPERRRSLERTFARGTDR